MRILSILLLVAACAPTGPSDTPDVPENPDLPVDTVPADDTDPTDTPDDTDGPDDSAVPDTDDTDVALPPEPLACVGTLDPTFDGDGLAAFYAPTATYDSNAWSVAVDDHDRTLLGGAYYSDGRGRTASLVRIHADGSLDTTFGTGGWRTDLFASSSTIKSLVVLSNGNILAGGHIGGTSTLMRFGPDGAWDDTFGTGGWVSHPGMIDDGFAFETLLVDGDGVILGGAVSGVPTLVRYDATGTLDTAWASGAATVDLGPQGTLLTLARDPDGSILVGGEASGDISIARVGADGLQDPGFGSGGSVQIDVLDDDRIRGLAVDDSGRIVGMGTMGFSYGYADDADWVVVRLMADGSLDTSFGGDGVVELDIDTNLTPGVGDQDRGRDILPLPTGELLVLGQTKASSGAGRMMVARLQADGTPDPCFGTDGFLPLHGFGVLQQGDTPGGMVWSADGTAVVVGGALNASATGYNGVARVLP